MKIFGKLGKKVKEKNEKNIRTKFEMGKRKMRIGNSMRNIRIAFYAHIYITFIDSFINVLLHYN